MNGLLKSAKAQLVVSGALMLFVTSPFQLPAFAETINLAWEAPLTNEDGTPLSDLSHYKLYLGNESSNYTQAIDSIASTSYALTLSPGRYFATVTAIDNNQNESAPAVEIQFYVNQENSVDHDSDGILNDSDNCPKHYNPLQEDANSNGIGDACEAVPNPYKRVALDFDGDGYSDVGIFDPSNPRSIVHSIFYSSDGSLRDSVGGNKKSKVAYGDYDGDGVSETVIIVKNRRLLEWHLASNSEAVKPIVFGRESDTYLGGCDFDGDRIDDPAVLTAKNQLRYLSSANGSTVKVAVGLARGAKIRDLTCGDLNGDKLDDLLILSETVQPNKRRRQIILSAHSTLSRKALFSRKAPGAVNVIALDINSDQVDEAGYITRNKQFSQLNLLIKDQTIQYSLPAMREFTVGSFMGENLAPYVGISLISTDSKLQVVNLRNGEVQTVLEPAYVLGKRLVKAFNYSLGRVPRRSR